MESSLRYSHCFQYFGHLSKSTLTSLILPLDCKGTVVTRSSPRPAQLMNSGRKWTDLSNTIISNRTRVTCQIGLNVSLLLCHVRAHIFRYLPLLANESERTCALCRIKDLGINLNLQGGFCSPSTSKMEMAYSGLSVSLFHAESSEVSRPQTLSLGYFDEAKNAKQIFTFFFASQNLMFTPFE